ncbi:hypothetical protein [Streptomyces sp. SD31]|uniref:hypothetical protein n=1 Tax=Streptomyces sp. SD31 TaxID=3452208 RepID=UPI003F8CA138
MQWEMVMVCVMLLIVAAIGVAELRRRTKPEQQRISEAEQRFFAAAEPRVEVGASEANLKSEPLVRLALRHGYELERTGRRGAGPMKDSTYHFVLRGSEAKPAPFLPESPEYESYMRWEAARRRKLRRFYVVFYAGLIAILGLLGAAASAMR